MQTMNQAVATRPTQAVATTLKGLLESSAYQNRFKQILGERSAQFVASLIQVGSSTQLKKCDPHSVIAAAITAAALDLPIDKNLGFAHIVPYKEQAQFQMGYKGFVQLGLRTGQYRKMNAKAVNVEAFGGFDEVGDPVIKWSELDETKEAVGYVFAWQMVNGFTKAVYWPKKKVEAHAKRYSKAFASGYDTPWKSNFDAMALKTVIKDGLGHWGILSIEMRRALIEDQGVHKNVDADIEYPDNAPEVERKAPMIAGASPLEPAPIEVEGAKGAPIDDSNPDLNPQAPADAPSLVTNGNVTAMEPAGELPDLDNPLPELIKRMNAASVTEPQMLTYARNQKLAKAEQTALSQLSTAKLKNFVVNWAAIADAVKATPVA